MPGSPTYIDSLTYWPEEEEEVLGRQGNRALTALAWLSSSIGDLAEAEVMTQYEMQEALTRVDEMTRAQYIERSTVSKFLTASSLLLLYVTCAFPRSGQCHQQVTIARTTHMTAATCHH